MAKYGRKDGLAVYYNAVDKGNSIQFVIKAASGQILLGRDKQKQKSRSFTQEHQARAWLVNNGYTKVLY